MKNLFLGIAALSILTVSCKKDEKATYIKEEANAQPSVAMNTAPKASLIDQAGITQTAASPVASGLNPAHGQPGHRCEIPVGQPLSSAPPQATTSQNISMNGNNQTIQIDPNTVSPGKINTTPNGQQVKTAPGMNPPHGESGHRCDIPVGQPLSSKPAPQVTPTNIVQTTTPPPAAKNLASGEKPKLNPAHGEPFHNCALKVGDPLL